MKRVKTVLCIEILSYKKSIATVVLLCLLRVEF